MPPVESRCNQLKLGHPHFSWNARLGPDKSGYGTFAAPGLEISGSRIYKESGMDSHFRSA